MAVGDQTNVQKTKNKSKSKKKVPVKGDPDYLSPTQLRNRRKRRAAKQEKGPGTNESDATKSKSDGDAKQNASSSKKQNKPKDPSMKYISNPKGAPIVQAAKKYFQSIQSKYTTKSIKFHVHLGPLYEWRTVSKLAVRAANTTKNEKPKVAIGLFLPQSHTLLPVPNCKAHHPSINKVVECVTHACHEVGIEPYQEISNENKHNGGEVDFSVKGKGQLRYIGVNIERETGSAQLTLVWNGDAPKNEDIEDPHLDKLVKKILSMAADSTNDGKSSGVDEMKHTEPSQADEPPAKKRRRRGNRDGKSVTKDDKNLSSSNNASKAKDAAVNNMTTSQNLPKVKLHSIWVNYNLSWKHSNAIFSFDATCWKCVHGPTAIIEHLMFDNKISQSSKAYAKPPAADYPITLHFPPTVFRQANLDAFTNIVGRIRERVMTLGKESKPMPNCIELYGGVGTIGLHLSDIVSSLVSSDENPNNLKCFNDSVSALPAEIQSRLEYQQKNATDMILTEAALFKKCQVLVVDPPRKGLDEEVVDYLCQTGYQTLKLVVYVSCGFQAFQRDCNAMLGCGHWKLEFAEGYLLFPGSDAVETLAFFVSA